MPTENRVMIFPYLSIESFDLSSAVWWLLIPNCIMATQFDPTIFQELLEMLWYHLHCQPNIPDLYATNVYLALLSFVSMQQRNRQKLCF